MCTWPDWFRWNSSWRRRSSFSSALASAEGSSWGKRADHSPTIASTTSFTFASYSTGADLGASAGRMRFGMSSEGLGSGGGGVGGRGLIGREVERVRRR